jgi:protein O-mannosyl-transferase
VIRKYLLIIVAVGILVFGNSVVNGFVRDDIAQIVTNINIHSIRNIPKFFTGSTFYEGGSKRLSGVYYKPILNTIFSLIFTVFGQNPPAFHSIQIVLHIGTAFMVFLLFVQIFDSVIALLLALIFLVHPINSESVLYVSALQEILFVLFGLIGLYILEHDRLTKFTLPAFASFICSLLSKETGALFFVIAVLYAYIFNKKYKWQLLGATSVIVIIYLIIRHNTVGVIVNPLNVPITKLALLDRLLMLPAIVFFYIKQFIFPFYLSSSYQWVFTHIDIYSFLFPLVVDIVVFITLFAIGIKVRKNYYFFFYLWFILGMIVHVQLIPLDATVSERWFYFPIVGILGMIGVMLNGCINKRNKTVFMIVSIIIISLLAIRTLVRSFDWRNDFTLASRDIRTSSGAYDLENILAAEYLKQNRLDDAKFYALRSVEHFPYVTTYNTLGLVYIAAGEYDKAKQTFQTGLSYGDYYALYDNLAMLMVMTGNNDENMQFLYKATTILPDDSKLWTCLAVMYYQQNNTIQAKNAISRAYTLDRSSFVSSFYDTIMNDQPLNLRFNMR